MNNKKPANDAELKIIKRVTTQALAAFGSPEALAAELGVSANAIFHWRAGTHVPATHYFLRMQKIAEGK